MKRPARHSLPLRFLRCAARTACVLILAIVTSYCTPNENQTEITELSSDESYLVESYVKVQKARDLHPVSPLKSDSLFAVLDSTIDTLRIANTIRSLNRNPDRWVLVFRRIEEKSAQIDRDELDLKNGGSEEGR